MTMYLVFGKVNVMGGWWLLTISTALTRTSQRRNTCALEVGVRLPGRLSRKTIFVSQLINC